MHIIIKNKKLFLNQYKIKCSIGKRGIGKKLVKKVEEKLKKLKIDNVWMNARESAMQFYELGLGDYFTLSAQNNRCIGDLLDGVIKLLPKKQIQDIRLNAKFHIDKLELIDQ